MSVPGVNGPSAAAGLQMELLVQALTRELDQAQQLQQAPGAEGAPAAPPLPGTPTAPVLTPGAGPEGAGVAGSAITAEPSPGDLLRGGVPGQSETSHQPPSLPAAQASSPTAWPTEPTAHQALLQAQGADGMADARPSAERLRHEERTGAAINTPAAAPESALAGGASAEPASAAQLVPIILAALHPGQIPPPLQRRVAEEDLVSRERRERRERRQRDGGADEDDGEHLPASGLEESLADADTPAGFQPHEPLPDAVHAATSGAGQQTWCAALIEALKHQAHQSAAQPALQMAARQWLQGRCVVLACPQAASTPAIGWVFVLWRTAAGSGLALQGRRFTARLRWAQLPVPGAWWAVRTVKDHQAARGRQLCTLADVHVPNRAPGPRAAGAMSCELQLGPVRPLVARWQDLCIQIDAAHGFWLALGAQWTVPVLATTEALLPELSDLHDVTNSTPAQLKH